MAKRSKTTPTPAAVIFSYVLPTDTGFAPNPFGGFLTLATCKPKIRKHANKGDFIVGTGSLNTVGTNKLVYAAQVLKVIPIADYGMLPDYEIKRPSNLEWWSKHGDNIYFKTGERWNRRDSGHHCEKAHMRTDLEGENVLVCARFWYFGKDAVGIPKRFHEVIKKGPGHKKITDQLFVAKFVEWLETLPEGVHGHPSTPHFV